MTTTFDDTITLFPVPSAAAAVNVTIHNHLPTPARAAMAGAAAVGKKLSPKPPAAAAGSPATTAITGTAASAEVTRETKDDAISGARSTIYRDSKGTEAILTEDTSDHSKVTLRIVHKNGDTLTVQGNRRGFDAKVGGHEQKADAWRIIGFDDVVHCAGKKEDVGVNETESVTRDRLQQFAKDNPQLAAALRGIDLPVTVAGGLPVNFKQAVEKPTQYRACPDTNAGIVVERLK